MLFNYTLGLEEIGAKANIVHREAVRAIILNKDSIFMIHNNNNNKEIKRLKG